MNRKYLTHRLDITMEEYFNGTRTIEHEDGSVTNITYEHEPPYVPMTLKQNAILYGSLLGLAGVCIAVPVSLEKLADRFDNRRRIRTRQKLNQEIFNNMKTH